LKPFVKFILAGSVVATVEEFLTIVVLKRDWPSYVFTLLILFPIFLTLVFFTSRALDRFWKTENAREVAHFATYGMAGMMIEWFLIGLAPWKNSHGHPILMLLFQLGMFSFWSTVGFAPRLYLNSSEAARHTRRKLARFFRIWFAFVYPLVLILPQEKRFGPTIVLIILGYLTVNVGFLRYFWAASHRSESPAPSPMQ